MSALVVPLADAGRGDLARVGGKGASLGELMRAGFAVPDGFCVTVRAYGLHLDEAALDPGATGADALRAAIVERPLPAAVVTAVDEALARLGPVDVAVRSSAVDEDSAGSSFAGQHDTLLGVRGTAAVLDALRTCWASLWSPRAVEYRRRGGRDAAGDMACVVQRMVAAETAGVLFTADPVSGERDRIVVNVVAGLGESLVSGRATARQVVLAKKDGGALSGDPAVLGVPAREFVQAAARAEAHFGAPQDVEWATAGGRLFLLQARPITNLPPEPVSLREAERPVLYYPERVREMLPGPVTPLTADFAFHCVAPAVQENLVRHRLLPRVVARRMPFTNAVIEGRLYLDLGPLRHGVLPGLDEVSLVDLLEHGRRPPLSAVRLPLLLRMGPAALVAAFTGARMMRRLDRLAARVCHELDALMAPLERADFASWTEEELRGLMRLRHPPDLLERIVATPPANPLARMLGTPFYTALERLVVRWAGEPPGTAASLVAALPGLPEMECAHALWALAEAARARPSVRAALETDPANAPAALAADPAAQEWLGGFRAFLDRFGHRAIEEVELARPRWREEPAYPLGVIASYLRLPPEAAPRAVEARRRALREQTEARIQGRLHWRPWRRWVLGLVLDVARQASSAGETTKFQIVRLLAVVRAAALELGRRRVAQGRLDDAGDVFFLGYDELGPEVGGLRERVARRREEHRRQKAQDPPRLIDARRRPIREMLRAAPPAVRDNELRGIASSPGVVRGRVRVVLDPSLGFELHPGEVLVAPFTDPAWTPLFVTAAAVVVETGSLLSHASIVARELGLPSVVAVPHATRLLADGQEVEVDGTHGLVRILQHCDGTARGLH
jgi:rifampicin phosphotransferase